MLGRAFPILVTVAIACFGVAPFLIGAAPYESTMGLVQKIFYFHAPSGMTMFAGACVAGCASAAYLFTGKTSADRIAAAAVELTVLFGAIVLMTGPLWGRKAWGVWWQWDARLTSSLLLWMMFVACLLVRKYGGPGSAKLAAAVALFGMANVPFVYISVNYWRTIHPATSVVPTLPVDMGSALWFSVVCFILLFVLLLHLRVYLEEQRARLDALYLSLDE